jgi:hypothetical protein
MGEEQKTESTKEEFKTAYAEVCQSYHLIDDFRAKLLGFLPLVSGTGIFLLFSDTFIKNTNLSSKYLSVIGIFGSIVTLGLLFYELRGIQRCIRLRFVGEQLEESMHLQGQFKQWPHSVGRFINEPIAAGMIYSMVLAAWVYVTLISSGPSVAVWGAAAVFLIGFIGAWRFYHYVTNTEEKKWHRVLPHAK